jgi:hypothetical protein
VMERPIPHPTTTAKRGVLSWCGRVVCFPVSEHNFLVH